MNPVEIINEIIKKSGRDVSNIKINHTKAYTSIAFFDLSYIRIRIGPKTKCIFIPCHLDYILSSFNITATETGGWYRININDPDDIFNLSGLILEIYDYCYTKASGETFGCCSKYIECSDAKACIQEHEQWSKGCIYRRNLIKGKIFYGKNAMS